MNRDDLEMLREENLRPVLADLAQRIRAKSPQEVARHAGVDYSGDGGQGVFLVPMFGDQFSVSYPGLEVTGPGGAGAGRFERGMLLYYLRGGDGGAGDDEWVTLRELPGGQFYVAAFQGYSGDVLAREMAGDPDVLARAAGALGGVPEDMGDAGYSFQVLPRVRLAAVMWTGDDEFAPRASILFNRGACRHLPTDAMAGLGSGLVGRLLAAARRSPYLTDAE